jgi:MFS family permease
LSPEPAIGNPVKTEVLGVGPDLQDRTMARWAIVSLVIARIVYAINWLNIGAIFRIMENSISVGVLGLGAVTSAFYLGLGLTQIPAGILAANFGPKRVVVGGIILSSLATICITICTEILQVAALRFLVGAGMAMVFAPAVVLVSNLLGRNKGGMGVGIFNSSFNVGGLLGLYAWVVLATAEGWQGSLLLSGGLGIVSAVLVMQLVPRDTTSARTEQDLRRLMAVLRNGQLILLGLGTLGIQAGNLLISSFMIYYLNSTEGASLENSGLVASLVVVVPIATAILGGRIYDRTKRPKTIMVLSGLGVALSLVVAAFPGMLAATLAAFLGGAASGIGFTVAFAWAKDLNTFGPAYDGLSIAWVNGLSLTGAFFPPLIFSQVANSGGYPLAWLTGALICGAFTIPLVLQRGRAEARAE